MNATTIVWGVVADSIGLCHWVNHEGETTPDGRFVAYRHTVESSDPADDYASSHPSPLRLYWNHDETVGNLVALRRQYGKLMAVAETDLEPADLEALTEEHGDLRFSAGTSRRGTGPFTITELSLTPQPASVGLPAVRWHRPRVSKGDPPMWVREDLERGRKIEHRHRGAIEVYEPHVRPELPPLFGTGDRYGHNPREVFYAASAQILAVNGRPPRR